MRIFYSSILVITLGALLISFSGCSEGEISNLLPKKKTSASVYGNFLSSRFAQQENNTPDAVRYFEAALEKEPKNPELLSDGVVLYLRAGDIQKSVAMAQRFVDAGNTSSETTLLLAIDAIKNNDFDGAQTLLSSIKLTQGANALSTATGEWVSPLLHAWIYVGQKDYDKAIALLKTQSKTRLTSFITYQLALIYDVAGNSEQAKKLFDAVLKNAGRSLRLTEVAANFYMRQGNTERAKAITESFVEGNPAIEPQAFLQHSAPLITNAQQGAAELLLEVASFLYSNHMDELALRYVHLSLYLHPEFTHGKFLQANLLKSQKRYKEAAEVLLNITDPAYFARQAQLSLARVYLEMDEDAKAIALLETLSKNKAYQKDALLSLGDIYMDKKEYDAAVDIYSDVIGILKNPQTTDWAIYYARGIAYERTEQWIRAEQDFLKALELKKNQPDVLNYLGYSWLVQKKNIEQAKDMLKTAITLRPGDAHIIDSYGWALYSLGKYDEAEKYLERATLLLPYDPTTNEHLGDVYWKIGRTNEAKFQWQRALLYDPEEKERKIIEIKLKDGLEAGEEARNGVRTGKNGIE